MTLKKIIRVSQKKITRKNIKKGDKILIITDSHGNKNYPSGVKRTVENIVPELKKRGYQVKILHPYSKKDGKDLFIRFPMPMCPELKLPLNPFLTTFNYIKKYQPDAIFNTTVEAPLGFAASLACKLIPVFHPKLVKKIPFTLSYTTNIDQVVQLYIKKISQNVISLPLGFIQGLSHNIYKDAYKVMTPTSTIYKKLKKMKIKNAVLWSRGVDTSLFKPLKKNEKNAFYEYNWYQKNPLPIVITVSRVAIEKNLDAFLKPELKGWHRVVIGDGAYRAELETKYGHNPLIHFLGNKHGQELASLYRSADFFVMTSLTDTFGNVILESLASGVPVIAYKVQGPKDILNKKVGLMLDKNQNLLAPLNSISELHQKLYSIKSNDCVEYARKKYSIKKLIDNLLLNLAKIKWKKIINKQLNQLS